MNTWKRMAENAIGNIAAACDTDDVKQSWAMLHDAEADLANAIGALEPLVEEDDDND